MRPKPYVILGAIVCLTIIQIAAMHYGINGTLRTAIVGIIAGLVGYAIPTKE
ncbi:hypothetical protein LCGC14_0774240 [marine sediment metagenome]|uniref:Uncharacterized protein n=1 Tax=marine sediment metagenome TaxID=412755 RepID=A0A0F9SHE9_9ZZZZ